MKAIRSILDWIFPRRHRQFRFSKTVVQFDRIDRGGKGGSYSVVVASACGRVLLEAKFGRAKR